MIADSSKKMRFDWVIGKFGSSLKAWTKLKECSKQIYVASEYSANESYRD